MRSRPAVSLLIALVIGSPLLLAIVPAEPASASVTVTSHFIWVAPGNGTFVSPINNDATNGEGNALLFVTPNYSAGGVCGCVADTVPIGVIYNLFGGARWSITNLDESTNIDAGSTYNVLVVQKTTNKVFVQTATTGEHPRWGHLHQLAAYERQSECNDLDYTEFRIPTARTASSAIIQSAPTTTRH